MKNARRILCAVLCLCTLLSAAALPVFAAEEETASVSPNNVVTMMKMPTATETIWEIDFTQVSSVPTSLAWGTYGTGTVGTSNKRLVKGEGLTKTSSASNFTLKLKEPNPSVVGNYGDGCLIYSAVVNFQKLPVVNDPSYTSPLSFMKWERYYTNASGSSATEYGRLICVDEKGRLYNDSRDLVSSDVCIPLNKDVTVTVVIDTRDEAVMYSCFVDGKYAFTDSLTYMAEYSSSALCLFDTRRSYDATVRKVWLAKAEPEYCIDSTLKANWKAIQTTKVQNGTYDLRALSLLDTLNYNKTGYEVTTIYRQTADSDWVTKTADMSTDTVYTSIEANENGVPTTWYASENGGKYIAPIRITGIDATLEHLEFCVRPYTETEDGLRIYGKAQYLICDGQDSSGYMQFILCDSARGNAVIKATEDTQIRFGSNCDKSYGANGTAEVKYNGGYGTKSSYSNSRMAFVKFDISDLPDDASEYTLNLFFDKSSSIAIRVTYVDPDMWDESLTATKAMANGIYNSDGWSTSFTNNSKPEIDITEVVNDAKKAGETQISFRIEFEKYQESYISLYTRESGNAPTISADATMFNYSTNLPQYKNVGYEPWGYADLVVADWWENIQSIYSRDYGKSTIVTDNAEDYASSIRVTTGSTPPDNATWTTSDKVTTLGTRSPSSVYGYTALTEAPEYDGYGGLAADGGKYYTDAYADKVNGTKGYFGTYYDETNDRWWFITPEGNRYIALGMCSVSFGSTVGQKALAKVTYGDKTGAEWTAAMFNQYGLNTTSSATLSSVDEGYLISGHTGIGLLSSYGTRIEVNASIGGSTIFANNNTMNVFDPDFVKYAYNRAITQIGSKAEETTRLGWTSDNELPANTDLLDRYLTLDPSNEKNAFSYATAWTWLRMVTGKANPTVEDALGSMEINMGGTVKEVSYRDLFRGFIYYRYYSIASAAVNNAAPNHLFLGCRELGNNYQCETVMRVAGYFCDVVTLNLYLGGDPDASVVANIHKWAGKPAYITEFYAKSAGVNDSGVETGVQAYGLWEVTYPADDTLTAKTYGVTDDGAAYYVDADLVKHVYYTANGTTQYKDADGVTQTVPKIILTNNRGAGKVVQSQDARGQYYQTFALKMLESGYCVGWSWYRYQDNDVSLYLDADGNIVLYNVWDMDVEGMTKIHSGEDTDQSNLDSNKGIVSNDMKVYTEFAEAIQEVSYNIFGLADYFDTTRRN